MIRGDIYRGDLGEPVGHEQSYDRPVVIVSAQPWLDRQPSVIATLPLTRTYRGETWHVEVEASSTGLRETSYVCCEDIRAISVRRLRGGQLGRIDAVQLAQVDQILRRLLAL